MTTSLKPLRGATALAVLLAGGVLLAGCTQADSTPGQTADASAAPAVTTDSADTEAATEGDLNVVVTEATIVDGTIETRAVVTGHIGEGTCEATATNASGDSVTASVEAVPDAQSTSCPLTVLEGIEGDDWSVVVKYTGDGVAGTSDETAAEVL